MEYKTETEITNVIESFENCTISREAWKHAEHLTVAMHYALHYDYPTAYEKMKSGIFRLLKSFGVDLRLEMPYHETLTIFWMKAVYEFVNSDGRGSVLETANEMVEKFDKDHPLKFYSREFLFSGEARAAYVEGDL